MRVRRVAREQSFWEALERDQPDTLPLWFSDAERPVIARTIGEAFAALEPDHEFSCGEIRVAAGAGDCVLATAAGREAAIARRYAAITNRPCLVADPSAVSSLRAAISPAAPRSLTWFCPLGEQDIAGALDTLVRAIETDGAAIPRLGVLTAENAAKLTWLLLKQLLPAPRETSAVTLVSGIDPTSPAHGTLEHLSTRQPLAEVVAGFHDARGTLLVNAHSRPHCGIMKVADGEAGMCGFETGGRDGVCAAGSDCHFGTAPRAVMHELSAPRVFFNGCTTAGVGTRRSELIPRSAMVIHSILRGGAREAIGNVRAGYHDEMDLDWFLGASALGYSPPDAIELIAAARRSAGQEQIRSTIYFGDATSPAWPVSGVSIGQVSIAQGGAVVRWQRADRVLVARLPHPALAELAERDRLFALADHPSQPRISVVRAPSDGASIVIAVPRREAAAGAGQEIEVSLHALAQPLDRTSIGSTLARAIDNLRWLERLPAFGTVLADAARDLDKELVTLRRAASWRADLARLPELLQYLAQREDAAARRFDGPLIDEALVRTRGYWNFQNEHAGRLRSTPRSGRGSCPICGAFASETSHADFANPKIERMTRVCGYCGITDDAPISCLRLRILPETLRDSTTHVSFTAEVANGGDRPMIATIGAGVERGGEMEESSTAKAVVQVPALGSATFDFELTPKKPMTELFQVRAYLASEGAFGLTSAFVMFGRRAARASEGQDRVGELFV